MLGCPPINPCLNDGICLPKPFGFSCVCKSPYTGNRCQEIKQTTLATTTITTSTKRSTTKSIIVLTNRFDPDLIYAQESTNNMIITNSCGNYDLVCRNNGICLETANGFKCQCLPQYMGKHCEICKYNR
jgi:hypothetical protein